MTEHTEVEYTYTEDYEEAKKGWNFGDTIHLYSKGFVTWVPVRRIGLEFPIKLEVSNRCKYNYRITRYVTKENK